MKFLLKFAFAIMAVVIGVMQTGGEKSSDRQTSDWEKLPQDAGGYVAEKTINFCKTHANQCLSAEKTINQLIIGK